MTTTEIKVLKLRLSHKLTFKQIGMELGGFSPTHAHRLFRTASRNSMLEVRYMRVCHCQREREQERRNNTPNVAEQEMFF